MIKTTSERDIRVIRVILIGVRLRGVGNNFGHVPL